MNSALSRFPISGSAAVALQSSMPDCGTLFSHLSEIRTELNKVVVPLQTIVREEVWLSHSLGHPRAWLFTYNYTFSHC
jgi:hypothetical protein